MNKKLIYPLYRRWKVIFIISNLTLFSLQPNVGEKVLSVKNLKLCFNSPEIDDKKCHASGLGKNV